DRTASFPGRYTRLACGLGGFSYSLYVVHMPLLVFWRAVLVPEQPWVPDLVHLGMAGAISVGAVAYAFLISRYTEAKTDTFRALFMRAVEKRLTPSYAVPRTEAHGIRTYSTPEPKVFTTFGPRRPSAGVDVGASGPGDAAAPFGPGPAR